MIYTILFATSLVLIILLISLKAWRGRHQGTLQTESEWFRIDLVKAHRALDHGLRTHSRSRIRRLLHGGLVLYQTFVAYVRSKLRRRIQKTLDHFAEENDPRPPSKRSTFLDDMHTHKEQLNGEHKANGIHSEFPEE